MLSFYRDECGSSYSIDESVFVYLFRTKEKAEQMTNKILVEDFILCWCCENDYENDEDYIELHTYIDELKNNIDNPEYVIDYDKIVDMYNNTYNVDNCVLNWDIKEQDFYLTEDEEFEMPILK